MNQSSFFKFATIGLLLLNLGLLSFFFFTKPRPTHSNENPRERAVKVMQLNQEQEQQFLDFAKNHMEEMKAFDQDQKPLLRSYFNSLIDSSLDKDPEIISKVQQIEFNKINATYQHFEDVKSILEDQQINGFNKFMHIALEDILLDRKKRRK